MDNGVHSFFTQHCISSCGTSYGRLFSFLQLSKQQRMITESRVTVISHACI